MRLLQIWRYPVKSLQGERLDQAALTSQGLDGDRRYAIFDIETGLDLTARRSPQMLFAAARLRTNGSVEITLPDATEAVDDGQLSAWLGRPVRLRSAGYAGSRRSEGPVSFEHEDGSPWEAYEGPAGAFHDSDQVNVSLVSTATTGEWDPRRFRANLLLDGSGEDSLVGSLVKVGDAVIRVQTRIERCVMTTRPQAGGLARDLDVLRTIHRERGGCLAVGARVVRPGRIQVHDSLHPVRKSA